MALYISIIILILYNYKKRSELIVVQQIYNIMLVK